MDQTSTNNEFIGEASVTDDGLPWSWRFFDPETDLVFKTIDGKELPPDAETQGKYYVIALQRILRLADGVTKTVECSWEGVGESCYRGPSPVTSKKKEDTNAQGQNFKQNMNASMQHPQQGAFYQNQQPGYYQQQGGYPHQQMMGQQAQAPPDQDKKKKNQKYSISSTFDNSNKEHMEYFEFWKKFYMVVLRHLCKDEVKGVCGLYHLREDEIKWEIIGPDRPHMSVSYPLFYPRDKTKGGAIVPGSSPSMFYGVNMDGPYMTKFVIPSKPPKIIQKPSILTPLGFKFIPKINAYRIIINGKGPTASIQINMKECIIKEINANSKSSTQGATLASILETTPDVGAAVESQIMTIMNTVHNNKKEEEALKLPQNGVANSTITVTHHQPTSAGIVPLGDPNQQYQPSVFHTQMLPQQQGGAMNQAPAPPQMPPGHTGTNPFQIAADTAPGMHPQQHMYQNPQYSNINSVLGQAPPQNTTGAMQPFLNSYQ